MNYRTFKLSDGRMADVPEDALDDFMQTLDASGLKFEDANVSADMQVGDPEVIKTPRKPAPAPAEPSMIDRFLDGGDAFVRGFNKSATWGANDHLGAAFNAATGGDFQTSLDESRYYDDKRQAEDPIPYGVGRALGFLPSIATGPAALAAKGLTGVGARALYSGGQGAIEGALSSEDAPIAQAGKGFGTGAALSVGGDAMQAGGTALRGLGVGQRMRSALNMDPKANKALIDERGIDFLEKDLPRRFDELGLASSPKPQSASDVYRTIGMEDSQGLRGAAGRQEGAAIDAAGEAGARGNWMDVDARMGDEQTALRGKARTPSDQTIGEVSALKAIRDRQPKPIPPEPEPVMVDRIPEPPQSYDDLIRAGAPSDQIEAAYARELNARPLKAPKPKRPSAFRGEVKPEPKRPAARYQPPEPDAPDLSQDMLDRLNEPLNVPPPLPQKVKAELIDESWNPYEASYATPRELHTQKVEYDQAGYPSEVAPASERAAATANRAAGSAVRGELDDTMRAAGDEFWTPYNEGRTDFRDLSDIGSLAKSRVAQNNSTSMFMNPWTYASSGAGAALGGLAGGPVGAAAGLVAGGGLGRAYGQDIAGMGLMGAGKGLRAAGRPMSAAAAPAGRAVGGETGDPVGAGRGYLLSEAAQQLLQEDPQSLGVYADALAQAWSDPEPSALSTLIIKLSRTDPTFRTGPLQALRARTQRDF